jgi:hypothetical protein
MNNSKKPYKYEKPIIIMIFGSMVLSPVSVVPKFHYASGMFPVSMLHGDGHFSPGVFIFTFV